MNKTLLVVGGPTASGKTELAIDLALHFDTEVISADARQFYRELSIGTAKPSDEELRKVPHHFINSHSVSYHLNAAEFGSLAQQKLTELFSVHDVVVMAGGSGLFIDSATGQIDDLPAASPEIRKYLQDLSDREGLQALQELLKAKDPVTHSRVDLMNPRRVMRALEVIMSTGVPYSGLIGKKKPEQPWKIIRAGIHRSRENLYERINLRTSAMIGNGLKEEAALVIEYRHLPALQTVGYREMFGHLEGRYSIEETEELIAQHTRNYAKRQLTWFRRYTDMIWVEPGEKEKIYESVGI